MYGTHCDLLCPDFHTSKRRREKCNFLLQESNPVSGVTLMDVKQAEEKANNDERKAEEG